MTQLSTTLLLLIFGVLSSQAFYFQGPHSQTPQAPSSFPIFSDFVKALGYPCETHDISTDDGYILTFFRIQAKNQASFKKGLPVTLLVHGLLDSADTWVINDEADAPGLQLANKGYDVWFGNVRGNKYSQGHTHLKPTDPAFWQFSWQNMSHYDLPASFEYIFRATGQNINYIGHSQGTIIMFAALSVGEPSVMKYLQRYIGLSPVAYVSHQQSGPAKLVANSNLLSLMEKLKINQFMPYNFFESDIGHYFCKNFVKICADFLAEIYGYDPDFDNFNQYNLILEHEPAGTSIMNMAHWKQLLETGKFNMFDYGKDGNMLHYGQSTPPDYNLGNITFPMHLFHGSVDPLADETDYTALIAALVNSKVNTKEYEADHMTFIWSKNMSFYWDDLLDALNSSSQEDYILEY